MQLPVQTSEWFFSRHPYFVSETCVPAFLFGGGRGDIFFYLLSAIMLFITAPNMFYCFSLPLQMSADLVE